MRAVSDRHSSSSCDARNLRVSIFVTVGELTWLFNLLPLQIDSKLVREDRIETMNRNNNPNQLVSVSSGQYMGVRDSLSNSVPYATKDTGRMILHDGNQAVVCHLVPPFAGAGNA